MGYVPATTSTMHLLTDSRATKAAILKELSWLVSGAKKGDLLIFHYSGHGSQLPDTSGDEIDKLDEVLCPHDYYTAGFIKDDDLRAAFAKVPAGVNLEVILDCCHSGTGTREMLSFECAPDEIKVTVRYAEPPIDFGFFIESNPTARKKGFLRSLPGEKELKIVAGMNHVLWGGCKDNQTSGEGVIDGKVRGFLTYCFCKCLRSKSGNVSRVNLDRMIASCLKGLGASQVPQLECTKEASAEKVFT